MASGCRNHRPDRARRSTRGSGAAACCRLRCRHRLPCRGGEQSGLGPGFTRGRTGTGFFGAVGLRRTAQGAAQGIAAAGRFDTGELQVPVGGDDAGKIRPRACSSPVPCRRRSVAPKRVRCRPAPCRRQGTRWPAAAWRRSGVHRNSRWRYWRRRRSTGRKQHAQLAGASVAQQLPVSQSEQARLG